MYAVTYRLPPTFQRNLTDIRLPCRATDTLPTKLYHPVISHHVVTMPNSSIHNLVNKKYNKMVSFVIRWKSLHTANLRVIILFGACFWTSKFSSSRPEDCNKWHTILRVSSLPYTTKLTEFAIPQSNQTGSGVHTTSYPTHTRVFLQG